MEVKVKVRKEVEETISIDLPLYYEYGGTVRRIYEDNGKVLMDYIGKWGDERCGRFGVPFVGIDKEWRPSTPAAFGKVFDDFSEYLSCVVDMLILKTIEE